MAAQCDINERERQPLRGCHKSEKKKKQSRLRQENQTVMNNAFLTKQIFTADRKSGGKLAHIARWRSSFSDRRRGPA
jgi:hypothetical protein